MDPVHDDECYAERRMWWNIAAPECVAPPCHQGMRATLLACGELSQQLRRVIVWAAVPGNTFNQQRVNI